MKKYFPHLRQSLLLFSGLSAIGALSACDMMGIGNPLSPSRPAQVVEGGRHQPALNPRNAPAQTATQATSMPAPQSKDYGSDPYDYFNEKSQQTAPAPAPAVAPAPLVAPAPAAAVQVTEPPIMTKNAAPAPVPPAPQSNNFLTHVVHSGTAERKSFPGNPDNGMSNNAVTVPQAPTPKADVSADTPMTSAPVNNEALQNPDVNANGAAEMTAASSPTFFSKVGGWFNSHADNTDEASADAGHVKGEAPTDTAPRMKKNISNVAPKSEDVPVKALDMAVEKPDSAQTAAPTTSDADSNPSLGKRISNLFSPERDTSQEEKLPQPAGDSNYPALSSVPPTPGQFQAVKDDKAAKIQDLQTEHTLSMQDKQALDNEPSGQQATRPVEMPADNSAPATSTTLPLPPALPSAPAAAEASGKPLLPLAESKPADTSTPEPAAAADKNQVLLGHASTVTAPDQAFGTQTSGIAPPPPPPTPTSSTAAPVADAAPAADVKAPVAAATPPASKSYWWQNANPPNGKKKPAANKEEKDNASDNAASDTASTQPPLSQPPMMNAAPVIPVPAPPPPAEPVAQTVPPVSNVAAPMPPAAATNTAPSVPAEMMAPPPPPPPAANAAPAPSTPAALQNAKTGANPDDNTLPTPEMLKAARMLPAGSDPNAP